MDPIDEIKHLYYKATAQTIQRDVARAIELLKTLPDEETRQRADVYMTGLSEMQAEWGGRRRRSAKESQSAPRLRSGQAQGPKGAREISRKPRR
jgi:hypothetical protein